MAKERTLSIIKPDAVASNIIGEILSRFEKAGLEIVAARMFKLNRVKAREFYAIHEGKPFYEGLIDFMSSGPIMVQVLEGDNAIKKHRDVIGSTDPTIAAPGTVRADFGARVERNAVHGSDSPETAQEEIAFFFSARQIWSRS